MKGIFCSLLLVLIYAASFAYFQIHGDYHFSALCWLIGLLAVFAVIYEALRVSLCTHVWLFSYAFSTDGRGCSKLGRAFITSTQKEPSAAFIEGVESHIGEAIAKTMSLPNVEVAALSYEYMGFYQLDNKQPKETVFL